MVKVREDVLEESSDGDDLNPAIRVRVRWRQNGGIRKAHRDREWGESRAREQKRRRHEDQASLLLPPRAPRADVATRGSVVAPIGFSGELAVQP
jgi:hypothetical protein